MYFAELYTLDNRKMKTSAVKLKRDDRGGQRGTIAITPQHKYPQKLLLSTLVLLLSRFLV